MRTLLSLEIRTPTVVWNRSLVTDSDPTQADLEFYYKTLCGLTEATVECKKHSIPPDFNMSLLSTIDRAPTQFPARDLETPVEEEERRAQYHKFISRLCEMEHSRAALGVFSAGVPDDESASASSDTNRVNHRLNHTRSWVQDLLRSLHEDEDGLVVSADDEGGGEEFTPIGWIATPVVAEIRETRGSRIILDASIGKHWERLLGTDVYPDLVVSRRISTLNWAFQHATSDVLIKATLDWYLASQDAKIVDGISDWIPDADREMAILFSTFKKIKVNERLIMEGLPRHSEKGGQVLKLLNTVESRLLASAHGNPEISPCPLDVFQKYMNYVFQAFGVPKEIYGKNEAMVQTLNRWVRSRFGFRSDVDPMLSSWKRMWSLVMRGNATAERVGLFLKTMDCWNPIEAMILTAPQKSAIAAEWVNIFIDNETIADTGSRVRSTLLHARTKDWCYRYLPEPVFPTSFSPMSIGPVFTRRGFVSVKRNDGRHTMGMRLKHETPVEDVSMTPTVAQQQPESTTAAAVYEPPMSIHLGTI